MAQPPKGLLSLPRELLVHVVVLATIDNVPELARIALTCRTLHKVVADDQTVWRELHNFKYDDPRRACAFPAPRRHYDWKQRVTDREVVRRSLSTTRDPAMYCDIHTSYYCDVGMERHREWARLFLRTMADLYHDLPAAGIPSRNASILSTMIYSHHFSQMEANPECVVGLASDERLFPYALFVHCDAFHEHWRRLTPWRRFLHFHHKSQSNAARDHTFWPGLFANTCLGVSRMMDRNGFPPGNLEPSLVKNAVEGGVESVRGNGILGLRRPSNLDSTEVWDWADLGGRWNDIHTRWAITLDPPGRRNRGVWEHGDTFEEPVSFDLTPVVDEQEVVQAFETTTGVADPRLWTDFPKCTFTPDAALPPIRFYGHNKTSSSPATKFIFGIVHLTNDSPPQLRWNGAIVDVEKPSLSQIFEAVHVGGRGARRGVFGAWKYWDREAEKRSKNEFIAKTLGMLWLWKP